MDSLFLLSTPSQAFFLSHTPEFVDKAILLITAKNKKKADQILDHVRQLDWKKIHVWTVLKGDNRVDHINLLIVRLKIFRFKRKYPTFQKVYMGSYTNLIHLSLVGEYNTDGKVFLLYDGLQMISVNAGRNLKTTEGNIRVFPELYRYLGFKKPSITELNYVSPVPLEISGRDTVTLINANISRPKKAYNENQIYFVGQPLHVIQLVSAEFYLETLKRFQELHSQHQIIYYPHPREDEDLIRRISEIFEIKALDMVFEEYFLASDSFAGTVVSFYSSVLINLMYFKADCKIVSLEIPEKELLKYKENIITIYKYFRSITSQNFQLFSIEKS